MAIYRIESYVEYGMQWFNAQMLGEGKEEWETSLFGPHWMRANALDDINTWKKINSEKHVPIQTFYEYID